MCSASAPLIDKDVVVDGLLARPELNGTVGKALDFDDSKGRYVVLVGGNRMALLAKNLRLYNVGAETVTIELHQRVTIHGLAGRPELNGKSGLVVLWDENKGRYGVQVDGILPPVLFRAANLRPERIEVKRRDKWAPEFRSKEIAEHLEAEEQHYLETEAKKSLSSAGNMFGFET